MRNRSDLSMRWNTQLIQLQVAHDLTATGGAILGNETARDTLGRERNELPGLFTYRSTLDLNRIGVLQVQLAFPHLH